MTCWRDGLLKYHLTVAQIRSEIKFLHECPYRLKILDWTYKNYPSWIPWYSHTHFIILGWLALAVPMGDSQGTARDRQLNLRARWGSLDHPPRRYGTLEIIPSFPHFWSEPNGVRRTQTHSNSLAVSGCLPCETASALCSKIIPERSLNASDVKLFFYISGCDRSLASSIFRLIG